MRYTWIKESFSDTICAAHTDYRSSCITIGIGGNIFLGENYIVQILFCAMNLCYMIHMYRYKPSHLCENYPHVST